MQRRRAHKVWECRKLVPTTRSSVLRSKTEQTSNLPRFKRMILQTRALAFQSSRPCFLLCALIANTFSLNPIWMALFCNNAAALILFGTGLRSAYDVAEWQRKKAGLGGIRLGEPAQWLIAFVTSPWSPQEMEGSDRIARWTESAFFAGRSLLLRIGARPLWVARLSLLAYLIVHAG